ncbi:MAG: DUF2911 domain-containing protein [Chitinophagaceae bacterium]|nr:DUF2911 domain-containing protein [Chitinophagaceae bacterium]
MKKILPLAFTAFLLFSSVILHAQDDKSKRPSPPATATGKIGNTTITINYSQPSVKGREIGKDLEPKEGKVWRTGANEATVFETDGDIKVEGKPLAKGKYALFTIKNGNDWTVIFNTKSNQWGAFGYKEAEDALRVQVKGSSTAADVTEQLTFTISNSGMISLHWGNLAVSFTVSE